MFPAESVESFKQRVENGKIKTATSHNYFAQLSPIGRTSFGNRRVSQSNDSKIAEINEQERINTLLELL